MPEWVYLVGLCIQVLLTGIIIPYFQRVNTKLDKVRDTQAEQGERLAALEALANIRPKKIVNPTE